MASNQAINYAPQCGDLTVESLVFHSNNVVGNFSYLKSAPSYHDICKYLINCPLAEAITKSPSLVYQNLLREFWCTATAYDPNPPINDSKARPLKEYIIKFSVKNGLRSTVSNEGAAKTTSFLEGPRGEKDSEGFKPPPDMELLTHPYPSGLMLLRELDNQPLILSTVADVQALLQSDDESDNNVLRAGEEMDEDIPPTDKEAQSSPPNQEQPESSHAQESGSLKKFNIILPLTERQLVKASIKGYYVENVDHIEKTDKLVQATVNSLEKNSTKRANAKSSTSLAWNVGHRLTQIKHTEACLQTDLSSLKKDTSEIKSMMIEIFQTFKECHTVTKEPPSHIEGENAYIDTDKAAEKESNTQNLELIQVHIIKQPMKSSCF
ncbi:hypothetical protein Tco_0158452 [Tanacetum coccineum]